MSASPARGSDCSLPPGLELRYVEAVTRLSPAAATGEIETEALAALTVPAEEQVAAREPARPVASAMRGTGEVLRASVQETLRPLLDEGDSPDAEFSEAVCRYKARLEAILDRESRIAYPDPARMGGREARLQIRFSLRKDGSLESVELPPLRRLRAGTGRGAAEGGEALSRLPGGDRLRAAHILLAGQFQPVLRTRRIAFAKDHTQGERVGGEGPQTPQEEGG